MSTGPLPGINYNVKPYVDDSSSLPTVGNMVSNLNDDGGLFIEGQVSATSAGPPRTVTINGFQMTSVVTSTGRQWLFSTLTGAVLPWQNMTYATAGSSIYWLGRNGT